MRRDTLMSTIQRSLNAIDYTKIACRKLRRLANSEGFEDMDSDTMIHYLQNDIDLIEFHMYLKRYLYEIAEIQEPFEEIDNEIYADIIRDAFKENRAPQSFNPTTKKWTATIKDWLTKAKVQRQTIFLLGFGLGMEPRDVSELLVKGIKEEDFNLTDKDEAIYYYCYYNQYRYQKAVELQEKYEKLERGSHDFRTNQEFDLKEILENSAPQKREEDFLNYLSWLKDENTTINNQKKAYDHFERLLLEVKKDILKEYQEEEFRKAEEKKKEAVILTIDQINNGDVEKKTCSGIPMTKSGNLQKMSSSKLNEVFQKYRLSRQRITGLVNRQLKIERFDLITLNFYLYAQVGVENEYQEYESDEEYYATEEQNKKERLDGFLKSMHEILEDCGMGDIYPTNPYENHILICLLTSDPLATFGEVWQDSY